MPDNSVIPGRYGDRRVVNHTGAVVINVEIQKKVTESEHIFIAMKVNEDDMSITQFQAY